MKKLSLILLSLFLFPTFSFSIILYSNNEEINNSTDAIIINTYTSFNNNNNNEINSGIVGVGGGTLSIMQTTIEANNNSFSGIKIDNEEMDIDFIPDTLNSANTYYDTLTIKNNQQYGIYINKGILNVTENTVSKNYWKILVSNTLQGSGHDIGNGIYITNESVVNIDI